LSTFSSLGSDVFNCDLLVVNNWHDLLSKHMSEQVTDGLALSVIVVKGDVFLEAQKLNLDKFQVGRHFGEDSLLNFSLGKVGVHPVLNSVEVIEADFAFLHVHIELLNL